MGQSPHHEAGPDHEDHRQRHFQRHQAAGGAEVGGSRGGAARRGAECRRCSQPRGTAAMDDIAPDELSPREALELIYKLKKLRGDI